MSREIAEVRFCPQYSKIGILYKVENKFNLRKTDGIDLADAEQVAKALGYDGAVIEVDGAGLESKKPVGAAA